MLNIIKSDHIICSNRLVIQILLNLKCSPNAKSILLNNYLINNLYGTSNGVFSLYSR